MAGLRSLLELGSASGGAVDYQEFHIYNTNKTNQNNGGSCCLWTVPANVNWVAFEVWGGGGGGAGACCCRAGWPGGSGSYARKFVTGLSEGQTFTMCAAGSTYCSQSYCCGCGGFPSYVTTGGAVQVCASGGSQGGTTCYFMINCNCQGCTPHQCGSWIGDMGICGVTGSAKGSSFCSQNAFGYMPSAPFTPGGNRGTYSYCRQTSGNGIGGSPHWPGGGGASAVNHDGNLRCGAPGAGGLITIYYPQGS